MTIDKFNLGGGFCLGSGLSSSHGFGPTSEIGTGSKFGGDIGFGSSIKGDGFRPFGGDLKKQSNVVYYYWH